MIVCVPVDRVEMDSVAVPSEVSVPVPSTLVPSRKRADPEGVPCAPCTTAVKVTFCPQRAELVVVAMLVVVESCNTVTLAAFEVEPECSASPEYTAVTMCVPAAKFAPALVGHVASTAVEMTQMPELLS